MHTMREPSRLAVPPPLELDLTDAGRRVGWIADRRIGFCGFADAVEAARAAWAAHQAIARRIARRSGIAAPAFDDARPMLDRAAAPNAVLLDGKAVATIVPPGAGNPCGDDSFGFELTTPPPTNEIGIRASAYLVYRTLRKSGIRWARWAIAADEPPSPASSVRNGPR